MSPQESIAHYRITSKLGEGGMGAVYRATDTKLNRDVAIKILPDAFASDPDRLARFTREAQVLASLNHPNIAAIYGVEERAIVMELVEGESPGGPLPADEALAIIEQLIDALEYAHEKGIVHRDLKPANLKLTSDRRLKVLDFGLAKALSSESASTSNLASSPTLTMRATMAGVIMGTASYMSPEQARGHNVDKRADIWSFGVVVYELLTGKQLFAGGTLSDTLAAVLRQDVDLAVIPPRFRKLLRLCLTRDPLRRLRDISGARLLLEEEAAPPPPVVETSPRARWPYAVAAVCALAVIGAAMGAGAGWWRAAHPEPRKMMRLSVDLGPTAVQGQRGSAWLSPDGTRLLFLSALADASLKISTRPLDQPDATSLVAGTGEPFFSPDGQWAAVAGGGKIVKVPVQGGGPTTICESSDTASGAWGEDGTIVFDGAGLGLWAVSQNGDTPRQLTKPAEHGDRAHYFPRILPGGKAVIFTANHFAGDWDRSDIDVLMLKTGQWRTLIQGGYAARYVPTGHLLFVREGRVFAVGFDPGKQQLRGSPVPVIEDLAESISGAQTFDVAGNGTLVYRSGGGPKTGWPIAWLDSSGKTTPLVDRPALYRSPRLSPDGKSLAVSLKGSKGYDLWVVDVERRTSTQLTFDSNLSGEEVAWTPDGRYIMFATETPPGTWLIRGDGVGGARQLTDKSIRPQSFTPDGKRMVGSGRGLGAFAIPLDLSNPDHFKIGAPETVLKSNFLHDVEMSPDGRWIAFAARGLGSEELFVVPYRAGAVQPGGKWRISTAGGKFPRWSRTARELFFRDPNGRIQVVEYMIKGDSFVAGTPHMWSPARIRQTGVIANYDLAPDGKRIVAFPLSATDQEDTGNLHITFLLNFFDELKVRVP